MKSLRTSLEAEGIEVIGADQTIVPADVPFTMTMFDSFEVDPDVGAVVLGLDVGFNHQKLCLASLFLQVNKVPLIVSNDDRGVLVRGKIFPGAGS